MGNNNKTRIFECSDVSKREGMVRGGRVMNIMDITVNHKTLGTGHIKSIDSAGYIKIIFESGEKTFQYPKAFVEGHLTSDDSQINEYVLKERIRLQQEEQRQEEQRQEEIKRIADENTNIQRRPEVEKRSYNKSKQPQRLNPRPNVAFKCNYCDGGKTNQRIGFNGVCSDKMIEYNINIAKHRWCTQDDCDCSLYLHGKIKRKQLDKLMQDGGSVCYESQMLRDWSAFAGIIQTGENSGMPMRLLNVKLNSLAVLTTRLRDSEESDRVIFAVFLVDEKYEGDKCEAGYVSTDSEYRIELSSIEARKMKFWNYHANENDAGKPFWGSGLHRYFEDEEAAIMLRDIATIKGGTKDADLAQRFFKHFCQIKNIDENQLPKPNGALKR